MGFQAAHSEFSFFLDRRSRNLSTTASRHHGLDTLTGRPRASAQRGTGLGLGKFCGPVVVERGPGLGLGQLRGPVVVEEGDTWNRR